MRSLPWWPVWSSSRVGASTRSWSSPLPGRRPRSSGTGSGEPWAPPSLRQGRGPPWARRSGSRRLGSPDREPPIRSGASALPMPPARCRGRRCTLRGSRGSRDGRGNRGSRGSRGNREGPRIRANRNIREGRAPRPPWSFPRKRESRRRESGRQRKEIHRRWSWSRHGSGRTVSISGRRPGASKPPCTTSTGRASARSTVSASGRSPISPSRAGFPSASR